MIDGYDYSDCNTVLRESRQKAKKEHRCRECGRVIQIGELYLYEAMLEPDGWFCDHKTCRHCERVREWLVRTCGGFVYDMIREDLSEHVKEEYDIPVSIKMASIGMARRWRRRDGSLWRLPSLKPMGHGAH